MLPILQSCRWLPDLRDRFERRLLQLRQQYLQYYGADLPELWWFYEALLPLLHG